MKLCSSRRDSCTVGDTPKGISNRSSRGVEVEFKITTCNVKKLAYKKMGVNGNHHKENIITLYIQWSIFESTCYSAGEKHQKQQEQQK